MKPNTTDKSPEAQAARVRAVNAHPCPTCGSRPGIWCGPPKGWAYNPKHTVHAARLALQHDEETR